MNAKSKMKATMKTKLLILTALFSYSAFAQVVNNNGADIVSGTGSYWVVNSGNFTLISQSPATTTFDHLAIISGATLTIEPQSAVTVDNTLNIAGSLVLESNASGTAGIITNGTVTGAGATTVTAQRYMTGQRWHLTAASLGGQSINNLLTTSANAIRTDGADYAMMDYNENSNGWNAYFTAATAGNTEAGKGYAINRETDGIVTFTGTIPIANITSAITQAGEGWNLIGNPFPCAIGVTSDAVSTENFLSVNTNDLDPSYAALYIWDEQDSYDGTRNDYKIINNAGSGSLVRDYIQSGQGFFVKSKSGGSSVNLNRAMCAIQPGIAFKAATTPWPTINLIAESGDNASSTMIAFNEDMSTGLDVTYDAGMFKSNPDFALYSHLIEENGIDFGLQCLPENYDELVIPVGLDAPSGAEIIFSAESNNLPDNCLIILEDRDESILTPLHEDECSYTITLNSKNNSIGRFYLHTSYLTTSRKAIAQQNPYQVISKPEFGQIQIFGPLQQQSVVRVYDIRGRLITSMKPEQSNTNTLPFKNVKSGIYILQIQNDKNVINQKFYW